MKKPALKTFSRKSKPIRPRLNNIDLNSVPLAPELPSESSINLPDSTSETNWREVAEMSSKAAAAFKRDDSFAELGNHFPIPCLNMEIFKQISVSSQFDQSRHKLKRRRPECPHSNSKQVKHQ